MQQSTVRTSVKQGYSQLADAPEDTQLFPTGRELAEGVGYPAALLNTLPASAVDAFCGVSNVSMFAEINQGVAVLDLGAGAGMDSLVASRRTGKLGRVFAVDFSPAMLARAGQAVFDAGARNIELQLADAEKLPLGDSSIDVAMVNGIFNLNPYREQIFSELARVVKPGGVVYAAELVINSPLPQEEKNAASWFS